ncbi:gliding motility protein [Streptomyces sp. NPDC003016]
MEASPEEARAGDPTADTPGEAATEGTEGAAGTEKGAETPGTAEGESVEIPKQQSADEAADNEAGESAHK